MIDIPAVLTVEETAKFLRVGRSCAYAAIKSGDIPHIKVGRLVRVPRSQLEQMLGIQNADEASAGDADLVTNADAGGDRNEE